MPLFVDYIATKKVIAPALTSIGGGVSELYASLGVRITDAMSSPVDRARACGDIGRVGPADLLRALADFTYFNTSPGWEASARRLGPIGMPVRFSRAMAPIAR